MIVTSYGQLGARVRQRRLDLRKSQAKVALEAGVSRAFVIALEGGDRPGAEIVRVLSVLRAVRLSLDIAEAE